MLAEIHNKISGTGSNLSDRLEDQLTGDVFGALRYLPYELGLKRILAQVYYPEGEAAHWKKCLNHAYSYGEVDYKFWPSHSEGEIDLRIELPEAVLGIEVKYGSGLSSEDEDVAEAMDPAESSNQLIRYSRMLEAVGGGRSKFLVFLAPLVTMHAVERAMRGRPLAGEVRLGYLSWQSVLEALLAIDRDSLEAWQRLIITDIQDLLIKKRFVRFRGFHHKVETVVIRGDAYQYQGSRRKGRSLTWPADPIREDLNYVYHR